MDLSITTVTRETAPREFLASTHGIETARTVTLSKAAFAGENIEAGQALGEIAASGLYGPYDSAAADGTETFAGLLLNPCAFGEDDEAFGAMLTHAIVIESELPAPVDAAGKADQPLIQFV